MSVAAVDWALRRAPVGADASARLVLVYLADRADDEGRDAFPSIATLVEQSHLSRSTIKRILRRLEEQGLISRPLSYRPSSRGLGSACGIDRGRLTGGAGAQNDPS